MKLNLNNLIPFDVDSFRNPSGKSLLGVLPTSIEFKLSGTRIIRGPKRLRKALLVIVGHAYRINLNSADVLSSNTRGSGKENVNQKRK